MVLGLARMMFLFMPIILIQTVHLVGNITEDHVITLMLIEEGFIILMSSVHYGSLEQYLLSLIQCGSMALYKYFLIQVCPFIVIYLVNSAAQNTTCTDLGKFHMNYISLTQGNPGSQSGYHRVQWRNETRSTITPIKTGGFKTRSCKQSVLLVC